MIHGRIHITPTGDNSDAEANAEANAQILAGARALAAVHKVDVVRVEVAYPGEKWDASGDAVEVDLTDPDAPSISTLPPYSDVAP